MIKSLTICHICREIEAGRMVVHVVRELRSKQAKAEKNRAKSGTYVPPKVSIKELKQIFPCLSDATARLRLKDKCECIPVRVSQLEVGFKCTCLYTLHLIRMLCYRYKFALLDTA